MIWMKFDDRTSPANAETFTRHNTSVLSRFCAITNKYIFRWTSKLRVSEIENFAKVQLSNVLCQNVNVCQKMMFLSRPLLQAVGLSTAVKFYTFHSEIEGQGHG